MLNELNANQSSIEYQCCVSGGRVSLLFQITGAKLIAGLLTSTPNTYIVQNECATEIVRRHINYSWHGYCECDSSFILDIFGEKKVFLSEFSLLQFNLDDSIFLIEWLLALPTWVRAPPPWKINFKVIKCWQHMSSGAHAHTIGEKLWFHFENLLTGTSKGCVRFGGGAAKRRMDTNSNRLPIGEGCKILHIPPNSWTRLYLNLFIRSSRMDCDRPEMPQEGYSRCCKRSS